jgi:hypothetical protein
MRGCLRSCLIGRCAEADDLDHAIRLVEGTPCTRARGAIEVRPLRNLEQE